MSKRRGSRRPKPQPRRAEPVALRPVAGTTGRPAARTKAAVLHDLQVHQVELEQQNEELRRARSMLEEARDDYRELYDFAPVGYLCIDASDRVVAVNLTGAALLGVDRGVLQGRRALDLIAAQERRRFAEHLGEARRCGTAQTCTLHMGAAARPPFVAHVTSVVRRGGSRAPRGGTVWTSFADATERQAVEEALERSREDLRALAGRLQHAREDAEARIARDLHDDLGQTLTSLQLELLGVERAVEQVEPDAASGALLDRVVRASELAASTLVTLRRIAQGLHPPVLDLLGLAAALRQELRQFGARTGIVVEVRLEADTPPGDPVGTALFRICQEALTNVARHAAAGRVVVRLRARADEISLEVQDDGAGMPAGGAAASASLGVLGMQERARALGGQVVHSRAPGGGTLLSAVMPRR